MRSKEAEQYRRLYKTSRWLRLRKQKLREEPLCERHKAKGKVKAATVVNHRKPHKGNKALFFDYSNLESTCAPCHDSAIQSEERLGYSKEIGIDGYPIDPSHPANVNA
jgi:5-methylcytosine-specific restriction endonuclease McrA